MGAQLNIKDAETIRLARTLADWGGKSVTATIKAALEKEMDTLDAEREERRQAMREAVAEFQRNMPDEWRGKTSKQIMDEIYDEDGLPI